MKFISPKSERYFALALAFGVLALNLWVTSANRTGLEKIMLLGSASYKSIFVVQVGIAIVAVIFVYVGHSRRPGFNTLQKLSVRPWWASFGSVALIVAISILLFLILSSVLMFVEIQKPIGQWNFLPQIWVLVFTFAACALAAVAGRYLPIWAAAPLVVLGVIFASALAVQNAYEKPYWGNLFLLNMSLKTSISNSVNWSPVWYSIILWAVVGAGVVLAALVLRVKAGKYLAAFVIVGAVTGVAFSFQGLMQPFTKVRSSSEANCVAAAQVNLCLWPEVEIAYPKQRNELQAMLALAHDNGFMLPQTISVDTAKRTKGQVILGSIFAQSKVVLAKNLSSVLIANQNCPFPVDPTGKIITSVQARVALAAVMGAPIEQLAPTFEFDSASGARVLTGMESLSYLKITDTASAKAALTLWNSQKEGTCVVNG